jgi:hypothetical protein
MPESQDIKVVLRNAEGRFVAGSALNWGFVEDRTRALVFNYFSEQIEEQLALLRKTQGLVLQAEPVPAKEVYETCDCCRRLVTPFKVFFNGKKFLCHDCRAKAAAKPNLRHSAK